MIVDDHEIVREGLKLLLELEDDFAGTIEASSSDECFKLLLNSCPEIILMDLKMPGIDGIEATRLIKKEYPLIKIILLTNYDDDEFVIEALNAGADGYVLKDVKKDDLVKSIRKVLQGHAVIDSLVTRHLINKFKESNVVMASDNTFSRPKLTYRELQILSHVVEGKSNHEISESIHLSIDTVKTHLKNTYKKLGASSRTQAVRIAVQESLIHLSR